MVKYSKALRQRSRKYDKITQEERVQIVQMKENGSTCREISEIMNKNIKTIQSIKSIEKKSEYADLKKALIDFGFQKIMEMQQLDKRNSKIIGKQASKLIKEQLEEKTSDFWNLIPEQKKFSNKRRIIQQIVLNIVEKVQNVTHKTNDNHYQQTTIITKEEFEEKKDEVPNILIEQPIPLLIAKAYYRLMSLFIPTKNFYTCLQ
ncbi:unnamed protein product (macronuclear) [Paramecium tetraurelia]|uniref:HTH psq-type domain-containing protein n=1 Tax=Paramecium tetraurelia TaxID=5888 RepID=A0CXM6_PARTE|nr:uncharacterized protein GSPATT00011175001 [Paramecium tetraurelia]CAK75543.1 unnamed protein product [Paramecium tetraurelia]|eukprot:XP_001442940.1 hypothetical protein (macronuclear) [Paramecium tetraurelia strain d4-2]